MSAKSEIGTVSVTDKILVNNTKYNISQRSIIINRFLIIVMVKGHHPHQWAKVAACITDLTPDLQVLLS